MDADRDALAGEYAKGEILVVFSSGLYQSEKGAFINSAEEDLLLHSEDLMDVSRAAASEAAEEGRDQDAAINSIEPDAGSAVVKLIRSDKYSTEELLSMYSDHPGVLAAEPDYIFTAQDEDTGEYEETAILDEEENAASVSGEKTEKKTAEETEKTSDDEINEAGCIQETQEMSSEEAAGEVGDLTAYQYAYGNMPGGIKVPGWNSVSGNAQGTVVAVLDSGIDYDHPDLKEVMWDEGEKYPSLVAMGGGKYGFNAASARDGSSSADPADPHHHGTHCAGIVAAAWNGIGVSGAADGAKLMAVRHTTRGGSNYYSDTVRGFNYIKAAKEAGVNVVAVNNSYGTNGNTQTVLGYVVRELEKDGVVCCFATSNEGVDNDIHVHTGSVLSDIPNSIMVGAQTEDAQRAMFSDYGIRSTHIFSPGKSILSTIPTDQAVVLPEIDYSKPVRDVSGNTSGDDFGTASTNMIITDNTGAGTEHKIEEGSLKITKMTLNSVDKRDDLTKKTIGLTSFAPNGYDYATVPLTLSLRAPLSANRSLSLAFHMKTTEQGVKNNQAVLFMMKSNAGPWTMAYGYIIYLKSAYTSEVFKLPANADFDDIQIRPVVLSSKENFEEVVFDDIWITDAQAVPYGFDDGTSMAAPAVAGEVAILAKKFPNDNADLRAARVLAGADPVEGYRDICITGGKANVDKSLDESEYTPVINSLESEEDGLHLLGFFFGDNPVITLKQGKKTFTTSDSSLKMISNKPSAASGNEVILEAPEGLKSGELTVSVNNPSAKAGRQDYARILTLTDDHGYLMPFYTQLSGTETIGGIRPVRLAALDNSLILAGVSDGKGEYESYINSPAGGGKWEKLPFSICPADNTNIAAWNRKLIYVDTHGKLCIYEPEKGVTDSGILRLGNRKTTDDDGYVFYHDGKELLLFYTPVDTDAYGNTANSPTQVYSFDPAAFEAKYIGTLNGSYCGGDQHPVAAHNKTADGKTRIYLYGTDVLSGNAVPGIEAFILDDGFETKRITLKYPEDGDMVYSQKFASGDTQLYSGCACRDGIMISGIFRVESASANNPVILDDNYFYSFSDSENRVVPSTRRMAPAMMLQNLICPYKDRVYMLGSQTANSKRPAFCVANVNTWPAYGDEIIRADKPSEGTDTSVLLKRLTLNPSKLTLNSGENKKITAKPVFTDPSVSANVFFDTSNREVARVDNDGNVYAKDAGTAVITAYCGNRKAACKVTVKGVASPKINKTSLSLNSGDKELLIIERAFANGNEKITWKSSDTKVAAVNKGLISAKKEGSAKITATWKSGSTKKDFECLVTVKGIDVPKAETGDRAVTLSTAKNAKAEREKTTELTATLKGTDFRKRSVVFTSLNPKLADFGDAGSSVTISGDGLEEKASGKGTAKASLTGREAGIVYVKVESFDPSSGSTQRNVKVIKVTVNAPVQAITFEGTGNAYSSVGSASSGLVLKKGSSTAVYCSVSPGICTNYNNLKWSVSKGAPVSVKNGVITATKTSKKDSSGKPVPAVVKAVCGTAKLEISVTVE
ncbi:MAG: S8 family serine peptidase [Lachnospiraceae bacterium]|nr:S8 family serine peptidase [Lachnospiraceae bacterium]